MTYKFYQWISESGSLVYAASFASTSDAIAYLGNLPQGVYSITSVNVVNASTSYEVTVYGPQ